MSPTTKTTGRRPVAAAPSVAPITGAVEGIHLGGGGTVSNLGCGLGSHSVGLLLGGISVAAYRAVFQRWAMFHVPALVAWPLGILAVDALYYWVHRFSHEWNFLWAAHAVHHQSEDYNLTVSAREPYLSLFMLVPSGSGQRRARR